MNFTRIKLPRNISNKLTQLKTKTGLTPNILLRYGLMLSLKDQSNPLYEDQQCDGLELHRAVLLGELDAIACALVKQRYKKSPQYEDSLECFKAHLYRGVDILAAQITTLTDIKNMIN